MSVCSNFPVQTRLFFRFVISLCLVFYLQTNAQAQFSLGLQARVGYLVANHPNFPSIRAPSYAASLNFNHKASSRRIWSHFYNYPQAEHSIHVQTFGNKESIGWALAYVPSLRFNFLRKGRFQIQGQAGWGAAYVTKKFNTLTNTANIAVGARFNACSVLRLRFNYNIGTRLQASLGLGFTHYSNGGWENPNLGLNIFGTQLGLAYRFQKSEYSKQDSFDLRQLPKLDRSFRPFASVGIGFTEKAYGSVKYPFYIGVLGVSHRLSRISKLGLGLEYVYSTLSAEFYKHITGTAAPIQRLQRFSIMAQHELLFGHIGFVSNFGVYLNEHEGQRSFFYTKIGFHFYAKNYFLKHKHQLWAGVYVRTYGGEAEFIEFALGYNF
ncbi:MAG: acyloxyacyl hydrolase [Saprospiraceae bacterium]|nr:acyloxyacyl hydrolase [Saprospiraceae bacterium]